MKAMHEPFAVHTSAMEEGLEHAGIALELLPRPKQKSSDIEEKGNEPRPGQPGFARYMDQKMSGFCAKRGNALRVWAREKGASR